jgi:hypothetical protein
MTQNRLKSIIATGTAVLDLVLFILVQWGLLAKLGLTVESWQTMVGLIVVIATNVFAAYNNPTTADKF